MTGLTGRSEQSQTATLCVARRPSALVFVQDHDLRAFVEDVATEIGFEICSVSSATDFRALADDPPAAIIVHTRLDNPAELIALGKLSSVVVLSSSWAKTSAEELGAFCLIRLPFDLEEFEDQLRRCLEEVIARAG